MPLTYSFKETILARIRSHPGFRIEMLIGAVEELLAGDIAVGKSVLRDVVNGTIGFDALGKTVGISPKSLMRMLGPNGNPQAKNLFAVIGALQKNAGIKLEVTAKPAAKPRAQSAPRADKRKPGTATRARLGGGPSTTQPGFAEKATRFKRR